MAQPQISTKRLAISKSNAQIVSTVAVAAFVTIFCLVASNAVWSQTKYQARVTKAKTIAHLQLQKNIDAFATLQSHYQAFNAATTNAIGGSSSGSGDNDGTNTKIILDALPSSYDFPALTASIEKILSDNKLAVSDITGTDDQVAQQTNVDSPNPQPVSIPFSFTIANANYAAVQQAINALQNSIRPLQIDSMTISGGAGSMQLTVNAHTFYQPSKSLTISKQVVK